MKYLFILFLCAIAAITYGQDKTPTLKSVLLDQLRSTHNKKEWFVPASNSVASLTPQQANWKDSSENHSIAQLTTHLIFWNLDLLKRFNGEKPQDFGGDNKETFSPVDEKSWPATVARLDSVLTAWEAAVEKADETKLIKWYPTIAHIGTHNAYHTGQILYIRKMHGWWDDEKGVK